ncbi:putative T7SS-secreted protein [Streptomyces sp. NPDC088197]|uniref:putative T7SS-secreted protein n=1 Tax=unclassified Streptomyces TaxID=2593676 RepID=UPI0033A34275
MGRPSDWHILDMDRDPVPGDASRVKTLSRQLHEFADDVGGALRLVKGMQSEDAILAWAGLSADAFREEFGSTPKNLDKLHTSYRIAAEALESYWPDLEHAQYQADRALADGRTAHARLVSAQSGLNGAQDWVHTATSTADSYDPAKNHGATVPPPDSDQVRQATRDLAAAKARRADAQQAVSSAQSALDAAKRLAEQARGMREDAARRTVARLHEASDAGIRNRHWWEKAVHWVADHWDEIITVCKWIVAVLGIVVMIIGGPLAWLVVAAALLVLADTVTKYIQGKATLWDVLFAVLDCVPMTKGLTSLGKLAELYKAGGLLKIGAHALGSAKGALKNMASLIRDGGEGLRAITVAFKGGDRLPGGTIPFRDLSPKAKQLVKALEDGHIQIRPAEVNVTHLAELQKFAGVEHAIVQGPGGELRLFRGTEIGSSIPKDLRGRGYKFTVHTHPEDRIPGPPTDIERARGMRNSMQFDLDNKASRHVEAVVSRDGNVTFFDHNGIIDVPQGQYPPGGPMNDRGYVVRVPHV